MPQPSDDKPFRTHIETATPQIDIRHLADYMAASRQSQRRVVQGCKYRRITRVIQHTEARAVIYNYIRIGDSDPQKLLDRAALVREKLADDDFESEVNDHNADYIESFAGSYIIGVLPKAEISARQDIAPININGMSVRFGHHLLLRRTTTTNKQRIGAIMLRYAKGETLGINVGEWQAASMFGFLRMVYEAEAAEPERKLCVVLDAYAGKTHLAPGNAVYRFNEMRAAWPISRNDGLLSSRPETPFSDQIRTLPTRPATRFGRS
ncbi:MAG TPA: hypothetical protein VME45_03315 [Stellaceae bacterium]|nr:hypothetical protein [Stellaceae bacterium]